SATRLSAEVTGLAARSLLARLAGLPPAAGGPGRAGLVVLDAVRDCARETAGLLRGRAPDGDAHAALVRARTALAGAAGDGARPAVLRRHAAVLEVADAALAMSTAAGIAVRGQAGAERAAPGRFWYARMSAPRLWWHRLAGHAERRSVFFQNAARLALALAAARLIAGEDSLPHGFWVLLATLTLTRTTVRETRATVRVALTGTLVGALVAAGLLTLAGPDTAVYAAALPPLMLAAFTLGPVKGVGWAQALFTVLVAMVFAQLAPATWQLAEFRLLDVLAGSAVGAVFGLLAWPRGAQDELRRSAAVLLRGAAEIVVATTARIAAGGLREPVLGAPGHRSLQHALILAESAYAQYQSEPHGPPSAPGGRSGHGEHGEHGHAGHARNAGNADGQDWQATLLAAHHVLWGADRLLAVPAPVLVPPLEREPAAAVTRLGDRVAGRMLLVSAWLDPGGDTPHTPVALRDPAFHGVAAQPPDAPRG
ncbi:FUSC family protein, partial [Streptomyces sp. NPDC031705]|uniref:FUSC family protein n=1 Tax=Streptomyces sp. NPDC031705 TaxID=3155729 RepID=UPI0033E4C170